MNFEQQKNQLMNGWMEGLGFNDQQTFDNLSNNNSQKPIKNYSVFTLATKDPVPCLGHCNWTMLAWRHKQVYKTEKNRSADVNSKARSWWKLLQMGHNLLKHATQQTYQQKYTLRNNIRVDYGKIKLQFVTHFF